MRAVRAPWVVAVALLLDASMCFGADERLAVFATLGFGGVSAAEADFRSGLDAGADEAEMHITTGLGLAYDVELIEFLALGGISRLYIWGADPYAWESRGDNAGTGIDLAVQPRVHFDVKPVTLYLTLPTGLTIATKRDNRTARLLDTHYDFGVGYNWGLFAGVEYPFMAGAAAFLEVGWLLHTVFQRAEAAADPSIEADLEYRRGQFTLNLGAVF